MVQHHLRISLQPAFVLHARPYRNTSLLVELFTAEYGVVGAVARGARRRQSRLRGLMQPFRPLLVSCFGRGELVTLAGAEDQGPPWWFQGHALASAFYMNELLLRLVHRHDAHPRLFSGYRHALGQLAALNMNGDGRADHPAGVGRQGFALQRILRIYEKYLLQELGFGPVLNREARGGGAIEPQTLYHYYHDSGPVAVVQGGTAPADDSRQVRETHGVAVRGETLIALADDALDGPAVLKEAKRLLRYLLDVHLGDKPLGSRALLEVYGNAGAVAPLEPSRSDKEVL